MFCLSNEYSLTWACVSGDSTFLVFIVQKGTFLLWFFIFVKKKWNLFYLEAGESCLGNKTVGEKNEDVKCRKEQKNLSVAFYEFHLFSELITRNTRKGRIIAPPPLVKKKLCFSRGGRLFARQFSKKKNTKKWRKKFFFSEKCFQSGKKFVH